jgi:hypothetical protein
LLVFRSWFSPSFYSSREYHYLIFSVQFSVANPVMPLALPKTK